MNVELLRKIAAVIQEKPAEFKMDTWHEETVCGTTHCIAGWACHLASPQESYERFKWPVNDAAEILGISLAQADRLFWADYWPKGFGGWDATSEQAAARIEHFIATGGRE